MARPFLSRLAHLPVAPAQASGPVAFENTGTAEAYPVWDIRGPGRNFKATSAAGETLHWTGTLAADEKLSIDTMSGTVVDDQGRNRYSELGVAPRMWTIPPGTSTGMVEYEGTSPGAYLPAGEIVRTNLVKNPSFELGSDGWQVNQGTFVRRSSFPQMAGRVGTNVAEVTVDPAVTQTWFGLIQTVADGISVTPGQWVAAKVWLAHDNATLTKARLQAVLSGTGATTYRQSPLATAFFYEGDFREVVFQVPNDGTSMVRLQPQVIANAGTPPAGARLWVDQVMAVVAPTEALARAGIATYFDGASPTDISGAYAWAGAAHASPSTHRPSRLVGASRVAVSWRARKWLVI